jgi:hypothetical protein
LAAVGSFEIYREYDEDVSRADGPAAELWLGVAVALGRIDLAGKLVCAHPVRVEGSGRERPRDRLQVLCIPLVQKHMLDQAQAQARQL